MVGVNAGRRGRRPLQGNNVLGKIAEQEEKAGEEE